MLRLVLMTLVCLAVIWVAMASVTPGRRHRPAPEAEPAPLAAPGPARPLPAARDDAAPSASELAPDAGVATPAPAHPTQAMPGPVLLPSPQYPDTVAPGAGPEPATPPAGGEGQRRVTANRVNLRGGPGTDHAVVGSLTRDMLVTPLAPEADGWQHIRSEDGAEGWLSTQFLSAPLP